MGIVMGPVVRGNLALLSQNLSLPLYTNINSGLRTGSGTASIQAVNFVSKLLQNKKVLMDIAEQLSVQFSSFHLLSHVQLFATPWTVASQGSLSITNSQSLLKLMSIELVMPSNHLILSSTSPAFNLSQHQDLF